MLTQEEQRFYDKIFADDKKKLIITIGNTIRGDDGFGPYLAEHLSDYLANDKQISLLNAATVPESIIGSAVKSSPEKVIVFDAGDFGAKAGTLKKIDLEDLDSSGMFSTHGFPVKFLFSMLKRETGAEIIFICVQVKSLADCNVLSEEVIVQVQKLVQYFKNRFTRNMRKNTQH